MRECCICGEAFEDREIVLRLTSYVFNTEGGPKWTLLATRFQDGSEERIAHINCPVNAGAPMSLIGAEGGSVDG